MFNYIYHKNQLNVGKYTIHGSYGLQYMYMKHGDDCPPQNLIQQWKIPKVLNDCHISIKN